MSIDDGSFAVALPGDTERWRRAKAALNSGHDEKAIELLKELAAEGDWRASTSLGFIFESKGARDPKLYVVAAHWYSNALAKEHRPEPCLGLARYYYYGLGGEQDYRKALTYLERSSPKEKPEAALLLATLLHLGVADIPKDILRAKEYYNIACQAGFPLAMVHLSRIEFSKGKWYRAICLGARALLSLVNLLRKNVRDARLTGFVRKLK